LLVVAVLALVLWIATRGGDEPAREEPTGDGNQGADGTETTTWYSCGMHPWVLLPQPGECPVCHMELTPVQASEFTGEVTIDPTMVQNIGVRVAPVESGPVVRTIRTVGTVDYDETRVRDVNTKVAGWIEKLHVDYLGSPVRQGEPLFELYAPALYEAQEQYLLALEGVEAAEASVAPQAAESARRLAEDSRTRLLYYDLAPEQVEEIRARGTLSKAVTILSPWEGVVIEKHANEGMRLEPGMRVYRIADLSTVWVLATLYETQLPFVEVGQRAMMRLSYLPGIELEGRVLYVYPYVDRRTRQVNVRLEFENPELLLKPGMFATVELESTLARERTLAPRAAVIDTGERRIAFVSLGEGRFDPREVRTGVETGDGMIEVLTGLRPGELVVTSGQFLLDSEARIREGLERMIHAHGDSARAPAPAPKEGDRPRASAPEQGAPLDLPPEAGERLAAILAGYLAIGDVLAADRTAGIAEHARAIARDVDELLEVPLPTEPHFWHRHDEVATVRGKALELVGATELAEVRLAYADLSVALGTLLEATGVPAAFEGEVHELHCPMYLEGQGGSIWLQGAGAVRNPFFGRVMLGCFDARRPLKGGDGR
jgi:RND family efflux transporter MFP subunit